MHERFTDPARNTMQRAKQEAQRLRHEYIGTEHILLGIVEEGSGLAVTILKNLNIDLQKIHVEVEKIVRSGPDMVTMGRLRQTPRAKKVVEHAMEEARNLHHNYVGTEHLLLGLLREWDGVAAQVLMNLGVQLDEVRGNVVKLGFREPGAAEMGAAGTQETESGARALGRLVRRAAHVLTLGRRFGR
jgi:ATP-dependent Clp protease ATP-binding subunit ClpC